MWLGQRLWHLALKKSLPEIENSNVFLILVYPFDPICSLDELPWQSFWQWRTTLEGQWFNLRGSDDFE